MKPKQRVVQTFIRFGGDDSQEFHAVGRLRGEQIFIINPACCSARPGEKKGEGKWSFCLYSPARSRNLGIDDLEEIQKLFPLSAEHSKIVGVEFMHKTFFEIRFFAGRQDFADCAIDMIVKILRRFNVSEIRQLPPLVMSQQTLVWDKEEEHWRTLAHLHEKKFRKQMRSLLPKDI